MNLLPNEKNSAFRHLSVHALRESGLIHEAYQLDVFPRPVPPPPPPLDFFYALYSESLLFGASVPFEDQVSAQGKMDDFVFNCSLVSAAGYDGDIILDGGASYTQNGSTANFSSAHLDDTILMAFSFHVASAATVTLTTQLNTDSEEELVQFDLSLWDSEFVLIGGASDANWPKGTPYENVFNLAEAGQYYFLLLTPGVGAGASMEFVASMTCDVPYTMLEVEAIYEGDDSEPVRLPACS